MAAYHALYIGAQSGFWTVELYGGFWWLYARVVAASFVVLSGWNLEAKGRRGGRFKDFAVRALKLAVPSALITGTSLIMFGDRFVFFGVLHLLALSAILSWPLVGRPRLALVTGLMVLAAGLALGLRQFHWPYLAWLGFRPVQLHPVDYLPILPWFAWSAFGQAARGFWGRSVTATAGPTTAGQATANPTTAGQATARPAVEGDGPEHSAVAGDTAGWPMRGAWLAWLAWLGRHSLIIYLVHLPLLYGMALLVSAIIQG
jgi:uncharacterized membrane protein